jgi:imidazolonepropionase-like amidohydrolase
MAERFLIKGSYLWDGTGKNLLPENAVLVEGKRIMAVDKFSALNSSHGVKVLDFSGLTLLPGMIDCHTHHSLDASLDNFLGRMADEIPVLTARATELMKKDLLSGVTMCRTLGDKE